jgi:hypothetical protein
MKTRVADQPERRARKIYRELCRAGGHYGVHRGMTALTREEWRAIIEVRWQMARRLATQDSMVKGSGLCTQ